ncbi:sugar-binding protein, partial [Verrucomicrobiota bacterium]
GYRVKMDKGLTGHVTARTVDQELAAAPGKSSAESLSVDPAAYMDQLARYKASAVEFEEFRGMQVPVARISEQLAELVVGDQQSGTSLTVDGTVTAREMDACWKSGCFKLHVPGNTPPNADPATYGYVGKSEVNGKQCIYISFVCRDPDISKIKVSDGREAAALIMDDSVEVFLDTNNDRKDYYQLVVNAKGKYWAGYWPMAMSDGGKARAWKSSPVIKSTINKDAGQWTCEIMIPFDDIGGVPTKGTRWAVNFCRNFRGQVKDWQLQSWFAVYDKARNFHHPDLFGVFQW